jgi:hypothetical protein
MPESSITTNLTIEAPNQLATRPERRVRRRAQPGARTGSQHRRRCRVPASALAIRANGNRGVAAGGKLRQKRNPCARQQARLSSPYPTTDDPRSGPRPHQISGGAISFAQSIDRG